MAAVASTVNLMATEQPVELEAGTHTLRLSPGTTTRHGEFVFAICAGGC